jgi:hypothetical protein
LLLAKWQIYDPLHAAEQNKQEVWVCAELVGSAVFLPAAGILLVLLGKRINRFAIDPQNLSPKYTVSMIVCSLVGGTIVMFVTGSIISVLEKQGYVIRHGW